MISLTAHICCFLISLCCLLCYISNKTRSPHTVNKPDVSSNNNMFLASRRSDKLNYCSSQQNHRSSAIERERENHLLWDTVIRIRSMFHFQLLWAWRRGQIAALHRWQRGSSQSCHKTPTVDHCLASKNGIWDNDLPVKELDRLKKKKKKKVRKK